MNKKIENTSDLIKLLKKFEWSNLNKLHGCAHSSIIGFLSYEWIKLSKTHTVMDGVPAPDINVNRVHADLLLCDNRIPLIPVEVETTVSKYAEKLDAIKRYFDNYPTIKFGVMYLTNLIREDDKKYKHNWENLQERLKDHDMFKKPIILISGEKSPSIFQKEPFLKTLYRSDFANWELKNIDCWNSESRKIINLWTRK